jgi:hypothetical protein
MHKAAMVAMTFNGAMKHTETGAHHRASPAINPRSD